MENNELVENSTENVEAQTTEEIEGAESVEDIETETEKPQPKYTDEQLDEIVSRKLSRQKRKLDREYRKKQAKYSELETVLNAGLGTEDISEATAKLREFYQENDIEIPDVPTQRYSEDDLELVASAKADRFIKDSTFDELVDEVDYLANTPEDELTEEDKIIFLKLANERKKQEEEKAALALGINKKDLEAEDFIEYSKKNLNPELPVGDRYRIYLKETQPDKQINKMGSMKSGATHKTNEVKEFYTYEEASRFTREDLEKNPKLQKAIENSMTKW